MRSHRSTMPPSQDCCPPNACGLTLPQSGADGASSADFSVQLSRFYFNRALFCRTLCSGNMDIRPPTYRHIPPRKPHSGAF